MAGRATRLRVALGFGKAPRASVARGGWGAQNKFYKARERRQKATVALAAGGVAYRVGRSARRRVRARRARRDSKGKFT